MGAPPANHRLRHLLQEILREESDFSAFVMDRYLPVAQRFSDGQNRVQRTNLLLHHVAGQTVLADLRQAWPQQVAAYESQHGPIAPEHFLAQLRFAHPDAWLRTQALVFSLGASLLIGLWLVLRATAPTPIPTPAIPTPPPPHAPDLAPVMQPLSGQIRDCRGRPAQNVRFLVLAKHVETRTDPDGLFSLTIPGHPDEPVLVRIQPSPPAQPHDHWVNLGQQHLSLTTEPCEK